MDIAIPSLRSGENFTVRTSFRCRVADPAAVAEAGLADVDVLLTSYLREDDELCSLGRPFDIAEVHEVRRLVDARVLAYCLVAPANLTGLETRLSSVDTLTPSQLRTPRSNHNIGTKSRRMRL